MITKNECLEKLFLLKDEGIECEAQIKQLLLETQPSIEIIQFISNNIELNIRKFYEKLRKSYNDKKSKLYINIVKEITDPNEVLTTLAAMNLQILLFSKKVEDKQMFFRHSRASEITAVLNNYYKTYDITNCIKILRIIKTDLKALERIK